MRSFIISLACLFSASVFSAPTVLFETSMGNFEVELNSEKAPITVENFLKYVEDGSYEGTVFHRVIRNFMAQGGGFNTDLERVPTYKAIKLESKNGLSNDTATIAMARTGVPDSATRQFFINFKDNDFLNYSSEKTPGYAVFGKVTAGFEVVQQMATKKTASIDGFHDVPVEAIVINKVSIKQ